MGKYYNLYIQGFDENMGGGIPEKHTILIAGTPGTMKSTIAYNMLYRNAKENGIPGLFIPLEQDKENLTTQLTNMGYNAPDDKLRIFDLSMIRARTRQFRKQREHRDDSHEQTTPDKWDMDTLKMQILDLKKQADFELLVIDSLAVIELIYMIDKPREELFHFFKWLKDLGITTILIGEMPQDRNVFSRQDIDFLVDGLIHVKIEVSERGTTKRLITCVKMRGVEHSTDLYVLSHAEGQFKTVPYIR
jgi:KaiC/GvpD/RAD55 family RecA-like ATPase